MRNATATGSKNLNTRATRPLIPQKKIIAELFCSFYWVAVSDYTKAESDKERACTASGVSNPYFSWREGSFPKWRNGYSFLLNGPQLIVISCGKLKIGLFFTIVKLLINFRNSQKLKTDMFSDSVFYADHGKNIKNSEKHFLR